MSVKLKQLPTNSGVYIMKDKYGTVIYVGKAKNLKNRVSQYFHRNGSHTAKVMAMVSEIVDFDYIITPSETNALMLENNLIKEHKPYYNILLKDDKQYPFVKIDLTEAYPRLYLVRRFSSDHSKYFGPFMNGISIGNVMEIVNRTFRLRTCKLNFLKLPRNHRPCLNHYIGRCTAPCAGNGTAEEYMSRVADAMDFLRGNDTKLKKLLMERMLAASESEDFESALLYKKDYDTIERISRKQIAFNPQDFNMDVFAAVEGEYCSAIAVIVLRDGKILGGDTFVVRDGGLSVKQTLSQFMMNYYGKNGIQVNEVLVSCALEDVDVLAQQLSLQRGQSVTINTPQKGIRKSLTDMAMLNAGDRLKRATPSIAAAEEKAERGMQQLAAALNLDSVRRIECYDNSNISGTNPVSSMVVFRDGLPNKKHYRHFQVKTVVGADDFATMREIITRRMGRYHEGTDASFKELPDLIIIDGGRGQLSSAVEALNGCGVTVNVVGLAKREEELFLPSNPIPVILEKHSAGYHLIQRVRDEAHRFAIEYHRSIRQKKMTESELQEIDGVGAQTIKKLLEAFKGVTAIKKATVAELITAGVSQRVAENIYGHYHTAEDK